MTASRDEDIKKLAKLIGKIKIAMFTTQDDDGSLRSRPMATQELEKFDGQLWFFTKIDSPKVEEVAHQRHVNLSYADPDDQKFVSVSGTAVLIRDRAKAAELWRPLYKAWFPDGLEDPQLGLLRVDVNKAEYWDAPSSTMVNLLGFAKAAITGSPHRGREREGGREWRAPALTRQGERLSGDSPAGFLLA